MISSRHHTQQSIFVIEKVPNHTLSYEQNLLKEINFYTVYKEIS